ncbi:FG-GAP repeat protein [Cellulomonas sp. SLBN-39]|uniref:FG-GAP repeat protein n=1 Tax=Cellulomonas sp. SLBN-39 TaxID=2768446 RepID=UPI0011526819|nr:FG-GAP repeat protein [Cellulomonas sp. SLBN-39]
MRVFSNSGPGTTWAAQADIQPDDGGTATDRFGYSLALSGDGSTAIIAAAPLNSSNRVGPGLVYVFTRADSGWVQEQIIPSPTGTGTSFGDAIDVSNDGRHFVVGAPCAEWSTCNGAAYFFSKPVGATSWTLNTTTTCAAATGGLCGSTVAISGDGTVAAVGQPYYKTVSGSTTTRRPYVHTFRRPASASSWIYQAALASPAGDNALTDFGYRDSLSLSGDGSALVVGAPSLGVVNGSYVAGGIYTYRFSGASWGTPSLVTRSATTATPNRQMGYSVEISPDGLTMIAGAPDGSTTGAAGGGAVYRWTRSSVTALWVFTDTYTAGDTVTGDKFGSSVGLPGSAPSRPVVGAPFKDGVLTDAGAAYLY